MKLNVIIILFFLYGCMGDYKKSDRPWKSSIVHYGMSSCEKSLKKVHENKFKETDTKWNGNKAILYCGCSLDQMRKKLRDDEFLNKLRNGNLGIEMKTAGNFCKSKGINWYED